MNPVISMIESVRTTATADTKAAAVIEGIRGGRWQARVNEGRARYAEVLSETGDAKKAKQAASLLKNELPAVLLSGRFATRDKNVSLEEKLTAHSGLLCADLDNLAPDQMVACRAQLITSPHLWALFTSPTGTGLKAVFRVQADVADHEGSFRAVQAHVRELCRVEIDEACKDVGRPCFVSHDPGAYLNREATVLPPLATPLKSPATARPSPSVPINLSVRQRIATELLGTVDWTNDDTGYCACPGFDLHTNVNGHRDCWVRLDGAPTVYCVHISCRAPVEKVNQDLRSRIGKAEFIPTTTATVKPSSTAAEYLASDSGDAKDASDAPTGGSPLPVRVSAATRLVQLAEPLQFFHDSQGGCFAKLAIGGHIEIWPITSSKFRNWLAQEFYRKTGGATNRNTVNDALMILESKARFDSPVQETYLRIAPHDDGLLIDLCDAKWRALEITRNGCKVLNQSPVAFVRTPNMRALPEPGGAGALTPLWEMLNITASQRPLVAGWLLNAFHPCGPYFVAVLAGEQGSSKSCAARILRTLVDPSEIPLRSPPRDERDLLVGSANNWVLALDNLSSLPPWLSDGLCRISTGGGHSARRLFTDGEEFSLSVKRPVILTGIEDVATRPDLAERSLQLELESIPDDRRVAERVLWQRLDQARPAIFTALVNGLVRAVRDLPDLKPDRLPRMADAAMWATAGETALGWERGTFINAYWKNLHEGAEASLDAHPVGLAIRALLTSQPEWSGEPAHLLADLNQRAGDDHRHSKAWPTTPRALSACLRRLAQALRRAGIEFEASKGKRRLIRLCSERKSSSFASPPAPAALAAPVGDEKDANKQPIHGEPLTIGDKALL